jgi:hypothetical protein
MHLILQEIFLSKNLTTSLLLLIGIAVASPAGAAGFEVIVPHRAVYDIKLQDASKRSGIKGMNGRMVYEVTGNECEGISLKYRFLTKVTTARDEYLSDQHTSSFESADGKEFTFLSKSFLNEQLEETTKGRAVQTDEGISVTLTKPAAQKFKFADARFLSSYLARLITLAKDGEHFMRDDIYDGSDGGDETISTSSVISKLKNVDNSADEFGVEVSNQLKGMDAWFVAMSYFDKDTGATAEHTPVFESSFLLFENGVSSDLVMRYADYTLTGILKELDLFDNSPCKQGG